jgi:tRNA threonylcarbamoyl adenosine modification protein (Sua5/YciO/YrdC/YwlC family)
MLIELHTENPDKRQIRQLVALLKQGEVIIVPTDSIYALVCAIENNDAIEKICWLLGKKPQKANLSILCRDLSHISEYTMQIPNPVFKLMKQVLPGPYTFILKANTNVPKIFKANKKTVGIRVPDNAIIQNLVEELGQPLVSSSIHSEDEILQYLTDPEQIHNEWGHKVAAVIDGGAGHNTGSTVLDCTTGNVEIIREGLGMDRLL